MLTPKHLIELTDDEIADILEGLEEIGARRSPLAKRLNRKPNLTLLGGTYTNRGDQAVTRMLRENPFLLRDDNPHAETLRAALRRLRLADAKLEVSLSEGKPGEERNAIVKEHTAALDDLMPLAIEYAMAYEA